MFPGKQNLLDSIGSINTDLMPFCYTEEKKKDVTVSPCIQMDSSFWFDAINSG